MSGSTTTQAGKEQFYELTVLYTPENVSDCTGVVSETMKAIFRAGFAVISMDIEGKKSLYYPVTSKLGKLTEQALYVYFTLKGDGVPRELSTALESDKQVLRYLLMKVKR